LNVLQRRKSSESTSGLTVVFAILAMSLSLSLLAHHK
jgi:hypothetical protein